MNGISTKLIDRAARKSRKRDQKKHQIAESAIEALKSLGYANTSLRDIAELSGLSLGMLHYYFEDKIGLIVFCVTLYKQDFIEKVETAARGADDRDELIEAFATALAVSIVEDASTHRLWYDIRSQAMFDDAFRPAVEEIEAALIKTIEAISDRLGGLDDVEMAYAALDGVFRYLMQAQTSGSPKTVAEISDRFKRLLVRL